VPRTGPCRALSRDQAHEALYEGRIRLLADDEQAEVDRAEDGLDDRVVPVRFPSAGDLLSRQEVASPLAGPLAALSAESRDALARDFATALSPYTDDDVCFPMETHIVTAKA
jgi:hypothetical protein